MSERFHQTRFSTLATRLCRLIHYLSIYIPCLIQGNHGIGVVVVGSGYGDFDPHPVCLSTNEDDEDIGSCILLHVCLLTGYLRGRWIDWAVCLLSSRLVFSAFFCLLSAVCVLCCIIMLYSIHSILSIQYSFNWLVTDRAS